MPGRPHGFLGRKGFWEYCSDPFSEWFGRGKPRNFRRGESGQSPGSRYKLCRLSPMALQTLWYLLVEKDACALSGGPQEVIHKINLYAFKAKPCHLRQNIFTRVMPIQGLSWSCHQAASWRHSPIKIWLGPEGSPQSWCMWFGQDLALPGLLEQGFRFLAT